MAARSKLGRRYTAAQKAEVIRRVKGGETQAAVAKEAGISGWTVGQWVRAAKGGAKADRKPGRPRGTGSRRRRVATRSGGQNQEIAWSLDGDMLVVRIPLSRFVRQLALKALAGI